MPTIINTVEKTHRETEECSNYSGKGSQPELDVKRRKIPERITSDIDDFQKILPPKEHSSAFEAISVSESMKYRVKASNISSSNSFSPQPASIEKKAQSCHSESSAQLTSFTENQFKPNAISSRQNQLESLKSSNFISPIPLATSHWSSPRPLSSSTDMLSSSQSSWKRSPACSSTIPSTSAEASNNATPFLFSSFLAKLDEKSSRVDRTIEKFTLQDDTSKTSERVQKRSDTALRNDLRLTLHSVSSEDRSISKSIAIDYSTGKILQNICNSKKTSLHPTSTLSENISALDSFISDLANVESSNEAKNIIKQNKVKKDTDEKETPSLEALAFSKFSVKIEPLAGDDNSPSVDVHNGHDDLKMQTNLENNVHSSLSRPTPKETLSRSNPLPKRKYTCRTRKTKEAKISNISKIEQVPESRMTYHVEQKIENYSHYEIVVCTCANPNCEFVMQHSCRRSFASISENISQRKKCIARKRKNSSTHPLYSPKSSDASDGTTLLNDTDIEFLANSRLIYPNEELHCSFCNLTVKHSRCFGSPIQHSHRFQISNGRSTYKCTTCPFSADFTFSNQPYPNEDFTLEHSCQILHSL